MMIWNATVCPLDHSAGAGRVYHEICKIGYTSKLEEKQCRIRKKYRRNYRTAAARQRRNLSSIRGFVEGEGKEMSVVDMETQTSVRQVGSFHR